MNDYLEMQIDKTDERCVDTGKSSEIFVDTHIKPGLTILRIGLRTKAVKSLYRVQVEIEDIDGIERRQTALHHGDFWEYGPNFHIHPSGEDFRKYVELCSWKKGSDTISLHTYEYYRKLYDQVLTLKRRTPTSLPDVKIPIGRHIFGICAYGKDVTSITRNVVVDIDDAGELKEYHMV